MWIFFFFFFPFFMTHAALDCEFENDIPLAYYEKGASFHYDKHTEDKLKRLVKTFDTLETQEQRAVKIAAFLSFPPWLQLPVRVTVTLSFAVLFYDICFSNHETPIIPIGSEIFFYFRDNPTDSDLPSVSIGGCLFVVNRNKVVPDLTRTFGSFVLPLNHIRDIFRRECQPKRRSPNVPFSIFKLAECKVCGGNVNGAPTLWNDEKLSVIHSETPEIVMASVTHDPESDESVCEIEQSLHEDCPVSPAFWVDDLFRFGFGEDQQ